MEQHHTTIKQAITQATINPIVPNTDPRTIAMIRSRSVTKEKNQWIITEEFILYSNKDCIASVWCMCNGLCLKFDHFDRKILLKILGNEKEKNITQFLF